MSFFFTHCFNFKMCFNIYYFPVFYDYLALSSLLFLGRVTLSYVLFCYASATLLNSLIESFLFVLISSFLLIRCFVDFCLSVNLFLLWLSSSVSAGDVCPGCGASRGCGLCSVAGVSCDQMLRPLWGRGGGPPSRSVSPYLSLCLSLSLFRNSESDTAKAECGRPF